MIVPISEGGTNSRSMHCYFLLHILSHEHMIMHVLKLVWVKKGYMDQIIMIIANHSDNCERHNSFRLHDV